MFANASQTRVAAIAETEWGTTPSTPVFKVLRVTSESLQHQMQVGRTNELRADRNVSDLARLGQSAGGGVEFELTYGSWDDILESLFYKAWATDVLKNGTLEKSFSLEKTFEQGATDSYLRYTGMVADSLTLNCAAQAFVTGSASFIGRGGDTGTAIIAGATYTPANENEVLTASVDFAGLAMTGVSPTPSIMSLELTLSNNLRPQPVVGSQFLAGVGAGRFEVTGRLSAYFEDLDLYLAFLDGTTSSLLFTLGSVSTEKYTISVPKLKFENGVINTPGNDQDVMAEMTFTGIYDSGIAATAQITRAVA